MWANVQCGLPLDKHGFREGISTLDHILILCALIKQKPFAGRCLYSCFVDFKKTLWLVSTWQVLGTPPTTRHTTTFITNWKNNVYHNLCKSTNQKGCACEVMSDIGVKQACPFSLILFNLYIDELETCMDETNGCSSCLYVVAILLYIDDVVLLSKSWPSLQRVMNKLSKFCTLLALMWIYLRPKSLDTTKEP